MPAGIKKNNLINLVNSLDRTNAKITLAAAHYAEKVAKESMMKPKTGRLYKVNRTGKLHRASAPGQAPAIDTGNLVNSIHSEQVNRSEARTFTNVEYAPMLEFGTAKMAPRPFMTPAAIKAELFMQKYAVQEYRKLIRRVSF